MYGQTSRAYQMLVDAYRIVLERMHLKNLVLPAAMIAALCAGRPALANHGGGITDPAADDYGETATLGADASVAPAIATGTPGVDGTFAFQHTVNPGGVFASRTPSPVTRTQGTQPLLLMYFHDAGAPDMYHATDGAGGMGTWYNLLARNADTLRSYYAAMSGGRVDFNIRIVDMPLSPKSDGTAWDTTEAQNALLPGMGINAADYRFKLNYYQPNQQALINNPNIGAGSAGLGSVPGTGTSGGQAWFLYTDSSTLTHETGHNFSFSHDHSLLTGSGTPSYTYDFSTKQYVAAAASGPVNTPIGTVYSDYGSPYSVMGGGVGLTPRQKQSLGWMDSARFANLNALNTPGTTSGVRIYDDMADMPVVVSASSGPDVKYGVAHGYQNVYYDAALTRQGQTFHQDSATTGHWEAYTQRLDFYYRSGAGSVPGYANNPATPGVGVDLNNTYIGRLTPGQTLLEKDVGAMMFAPGKNLDDGSSVSGAATDLMSYTRSNTPQNQARYRSVWYQITYVDDGSDANGHYANLQVQSFTGAQVTGWQFDAVAGSAGAQDGSGTWTAGSGGNWHNVSLNVDNQNWTNGEDAVIGAGSGAAGTVTIAAGGVAANSLAFKAAGSGTYTLGGGALTLGGGGIVAEESAHVTAPVTVADTQFWTVSSGKQLTVDAAVTTSAGNALNKDGRGLLVLGAASTWNEALGVVEGQVDQTATQTISDALCINEGATYRVAGGTLAIGSGKSVSGLARFGYDTLTDNFSPGTLRLSRTDSSTAAPEVQFQGGGTLGTDVLLDAGQHVITTGGSAKITGDIAGAGGITLYAAASGNSLQLGGRTVVDNVNTFTGDLEIRKGVLNVAGATSLQGNNVLRFNTASGDAGRFNLNGFDRSVRDLSSAGAGSATITNNSAAAAANLVVTQDNAGTYAGTLADGAGQALGLVKRGSAQLSLTGDSSYSGGTTVAQGTLRTTGASSIGTGALTLAGGTFMVDQAPGLTLTKVAGNLLSGALPAGGRYTSDLSAITTPNAVGGTYAYTGKIYLTAGTWSFGKAFDDGASLTINGTQLFNNGVYNQSAYGDLSVAASGWYDVDLRLQNSGGGGPYAVDGWTTQGIGVKQGARAGANGSAYTSFADGVFGIQLRDDLVIANAVNLAADSTIEITNTQMASAETRLTGAVTGSGALTKTGAGTLTFAGAANTWSGTTFVNAGAVAAGAANTFSPNSAFVLADASGARLDLRDFGQTLGSLAGGGASGGNVALGSATLTVGLDGTDTTYAGVVSGTGGLVKAGAGAMTLARAQAYTGGTTVNAGTLRLDFSAAGAGASNLLASSGALNLGGGTLELKGASGAADVQSVNGLTLAANTASTLRSASSGATTADLRLGNLAVGAGATLDFAGGSGDTTSGGRFSFTTVNGGAVASGAKLGSFATWNGTDWAASTGVSDGAGGTFVGAYAGYLNIYNGTTSGTTVVPNNLPAADVKILESSGGWSHDTLQSSATTVASLLMSAAGHGATVDMTGKTLTVGDGANAAGAVMVAAGAKALILGESANAGILTSGTSGASSLLLVANNAAAADGLVVNAKIMDGGAGTTSLTASGGTGGGTVVLAGDNTYSGGTRVTSGGTLQVGDGNTSGTLGAGAVTMDAGATLAFKRSDAGLVLSNALSGAGAVAQTGSGTTVLTGDANTWSGGTSIAAGTLQIGDGGAHGTLGSGAVSGSGTLAFKRNNALTVSNTLGGAIAVAQTGSGTTVLTGDANTWSGATTITAGTLQIGDGGAHGTLGASAVSGSGTLAFKRSDALTVSNILGGAIAVAQTGSGTTVLTGDANTWSGATTITAGTLQIGDGGTHGTLGAGPVNNAGTLAFDRSDAGLTVAAVLHGAGAVVQTGTGTTTLTGANDYSGTTTISAGTLQIGNGAATGTLGSGAVAMGGGTLAFDRSNAMTVSNTVGGFGDLTQAGTGTTILTGANTYVGTTTISAGTLQVGNGGTAGTLGAGAIVDNGTLAFNRGDSVTLAGGISGTGGLTQMGAGTLVLTGANTYAGTTAINAGRTLQVGDGGTSGTLGTGPVADNGTLTFNRSDTVTVGQGVGSSGNLVQNGAGTLVLGAANTYAGTTTVNAGTLRVTSAAATLGQGALAVNAGGTFNFSGDTYGTYALPNAVTLNGGTVSSTGWFTTLTLNGAIVVGAGGGTFSTNTPDPYNGGDINVNGLVSGSGPLTLQNNRATYGVGRTWFNNAANTYSGSVTVVGVSGKPLLGLGASTALEQATLNLAPVSSATADTDQVAYASGLAAATVGGLTGNAWGGMKLQNGSTAVALTVNNAAANLFDGVLSGTGSLAKGGAGTLTLTHANTFAGPTAVNAGTLALDFSAAGAANSNILKSGSTVTLNGGTLKITGKAGLNGTVQSFASLSSGAGASTLQLVQNGATTMDINVGTLAFGAGTLNFTGATGTALGARVITSSSAGANDGATQLSATSALWNGAGWASVKQSGGVNYVVQWTGTYTNLTTNGNTANPTGDLKVVDGSGSGTAATFGANTTINSLLMAAPTYASTLALGGKILTVGAGSSGNLAIGASGKSLTVSNGTLTAGTSGAATLNLADGNAASSLTVNAGIADNGSAGGAVSLAAGGSGAVVLGGPLSYTGGTSVGSGSTLTLNSLLGGGAYAGAIAANGTLLLKNTGDQTLSGVLSGSGALTKDVATGASVLTLSGVNTFAGAVNIQSGTLKFGSTGALGAAQVKIGSGATLDLNGKVTTSTGTVFLAGSGVGGSGALVDNVPGSGTMNPSAALRNVTLSADATVSVAGGNILFGQTGGSAGTLGLAGHTLTLNGPAAATTGAGVLILNNLAASDAGNIVVNNGASLQIVNDYWVGSQNNVTLSGAGTITLNAGSKLALQRFNGGMTLSKAIVMNGGQIFSDGGPNNGTIASDISLQAASNVINFTGGYGNATFSGILSGGALAGLSVQGDNQTRTFTGVNTYLGDTTLGAGTLKIGGAGQLGAGNYAGAIAINGASTTFEYGSTAAQTLSGAVGGTGALVKSGSGDLTLTGTDTYSGNTTVSSGTLFLGGAGTLGGGTYAGAVTLSNNATLNDGSSADQTLSGVLGGAGNLVQSGSGTLTLAGANTYTGATTVAGGTLALGSASALGNTSALTFTGGTLQYSAANTADYSAKITSSTGAIAIDTHGQNVAFASALAASNTGGLAKSGAGTLTLSGANAYTGATTVAGGTLALGSASALGNTSALTFTGGTLQYSAANTVDYSAKITGSTGAIAIDTSGQNVAFASALAASNTGGLAKTGAGTLTLSGANAYGGDTAVSGGTLRLGGAGSLGGGSYAGQFTLAGGATLAVATSANQTLSGNLTGAGRLAKSGTGTLTLAGTGSDYTGTTTLAAGTLALGSANALGNTSALSFSGGTLRYGSGVTTDYSAKIAGSTSAIAVDTHGQNVTFASALAASNTGGLTKTGAGTLTLSGANLYGGTTTVSQGTLCLDYAGGSDRLATTGSLVMNGGEVLFANLGANSQTLASTLVLSGASNKLTRGAGWTSGTVDLGTLSWTGGAVDVSNIGVAASWIQASGNTNQAVLFGGAVTANGGVDAVGTDASGFLVLMGTTDYSQGGAIAGNAGATIRLIASGQGGNQAGQPITLAAAGTTDVGSILNAYTPGTKPDTDAAVTLDIGAGNTLRLGASGGLAAAAGTGLLVTGGTLTAGGADGAAGHITVNATDDITVASQVADNGLGFAVSLTKSGAGVLTLLGANTYTGSTLIAGGTLALGSASALGDTSALSFSGGTLRYDSGVTTDYSAKITGSTGAIDIDIAGATQTVTFASGLAASNTGGLAKSGAGTLTLAGANAYGGDTAVSGGTLALGGAGTLGGGSYAGNIALSNGATFANGSSADQTLSGDLTGDGNLAQTGGGTLTLSGANTYTGTTTLAGGTLALGSAGALGGTSALTFTGGTLQYSAANTADYSAKITGSTGAIAIDTHGQNITFASGLAASNTGGLAKSGAGTLTLSGANAYGGDTVVSDGTLSLGGAGTLGGGSYAGNITLSNGATFADGSSADQTLSGNLTGDGNLAQTGGGTLTLAGTNTYTGTTTLAGGTLALGSAGALGGTSALAFTGGNLRYGSGVATDLSVKIAGSSGAIAIDIAGATQTVTFASGLAASNTGGLTKTGAGTLTLSGANLYGGTTTVSGGTLCLDYAGGSDRLASTGSLALAGGEVLFANLSANSQTLASTRILSGASNKLTLGAGRTTGTVDLGAFSWNTGALDVSGLGAAASWLKVSSPTGQQRLFSGAVTANGGVDAVGTDANGFLVLVGTTDYSQGGAIAGAPGATLRLIASGQGGNLAGQAVTLAATGTTDVGSILNAYAPGTPNPGTNTSVTLDIGAGNTLRLGASGGLTAAAGTDLVVDNGTLTAGGANGAAGSILVNATDDITVNAKVADNGTGGTVSLAKSGSGTLTLADAASYTGLTTISGGTLAFTGASQTLAGGFLVDPGTTLQIGSGASATAFSIGADSRNNGTLRIRPGAAFSLTHGIVGSGQVDNAGTLRVADGVTLGNAVTNAAGSVFDTAGAAVTTGDLSFRAGSVFKVDGNTRVNAASATIAAGAKMQASTTGFLLGRQVALITTTGAVSGAADGTFDTSPSQAAPAGYRWVSASDAHHVYMGLQWAVLDGAGGAQQTAVQDALNRASGAVSVDPDLQAAFTRLANMPEDARRAGLDGYAGNDRRTAPAIDRLLVRRFNDMMQLSHTALTGGGAERFADAGQSSYDNGRASALNGWDLAEDENPGGLRLFTYAEHTSGDKPMGGGTAGDSSLSADAFTVGASRRFADDWNVGAAFGYDEASTSAPSGLGTLKAKSYGFNLYASHTFDPEGRLFVSGLAGVSMLTYDGHRQTLSGPATGSTKGANWSAAAQVGYKLDAWKDATFTPLAGFSYLHGTTQAYQETLPGAPGMALAYGEQTVNQFETVLGAELAQAFKVTGDIELTPMARVLWHHQLGDTDRQTVATHFAGDPATAFNTYLQSPNTDAVEMDLGAGAQFGSRWKAFLQVRLYQELGSDAGRQVGVGAGVSYSF